MPSVRAARPVSRAVFCDWHGVLSDSPFWAHLLSDPGHRLHGAAARVIQGLFADTPTLHGWMTGYLTDREAVGRHSEAADIDQMLAELNISCSRMLPDDELAGALLRLPGDCLRVLATDNMPCFAATAATNAHLIRLFDVVLCSSDVGTLKAKDPHQFFGAVLDAHGLTFADAVLLDDSARNCQRFRWAGGHAIRVHEEMNPAAAVDALYAAA